SELAAQDRQARQLGRLFKRAKVCDLLEALGLHERDRLRRSVARAAVDEVLGIGVEAGQRGRELATVEVEQLGSLEGSRGMLFRGAHVEHDYSLPDFEGGGGCLGRAR